MHESGYNYRYKKVLVIDDTDVDRLLADKIMKKYDFAEEVILMESAAEMMDYLNNYHVAPDASEELIFLDINMPETDGWQFLEQFDLLDEQVKENFKILVVSSSTDPKDKKRAFGNKYVVDFVTKPLSKDTILRLHAEIENKIYQRTQMLTEALKKEKELSQLKSRFISTASHEFRTPLSVILSSVNLLAKFTAAEEQPKREEYIDRIRSSVKNLTGILNDFLSVGKIEDGKLKVKYTETDLHEYTGTIVSEVQTLSSKGQQISYTHTGPHTVLTDTALYRLIVTNLLSNAIKYSHDNSTISVETHVDETGFMLTVSDNGIGISDENKQHLFELFFRGDNAVNIQGTGIGLHIVAKYTELMDGVIKCTSELGKGTQFTIFLPHQNLLHENDTAY